MSSSGLLLIVDFVRACGASSVLVNFGKLGLFMQDWGWPIHWALLSLSGDSGSVMVVNTVGAFEFWWDVGGIGLGSNLAKWFGSFSIQSVLGEEN